MVVVVVSGNREGEHIRVTEGQFHLGKLMSLPIDIEVFVSDGRGFIRGKFFLPGECSPGDWFEVDKKTLIRVDEFLLLCEPGETHETENNSKNKGYGSRNK